MTELSEEDRLIMELAVKTSNLKVALIKEGYDSLQIAHSFMAVATIIYRQSLSDPDEIAELVWRRLQQ